MEARYNYNMKIKEQKKQREGKMRRSNNIIAYKNLKNGYDYTLQVWVKNFIVLDCGHPEDMKEEGCCNAHRLAGQDIREITKKESE